MNERIVKLFMESVDSNYIPLPIEDHMPSWTEKFAKLIVKECLEQIDTVRDGCDEDGEHQQALGADWAGLAVARHFGIE